ncbi:hypothetical protein Htur_4232 (plasmid) [Haloterrigena turkmenica DSM 5511]|uniref:Uncharacterized protein n=1 Tax=Haloterrigena turkmenica (strain ATCC 51198 / DSM 5511 / JCM 9101 / NCIMB 13204 / VKM B-1734 / 4k) TaxID=543526 RepID=D2S105_HALTV|nr:hypothetical protein [Haloterrigena turkmenica]ADB63052.1 hypothetical protein Htur_4232 [Haloterrigena turkmenica DSM 5511]
MKVPRFLREADQGGAVVRTYDYDDESIIVVDLGQMSDIETDLVGKTAIVVIGDRQFEFELPPDASDISIKNGILTITE